MMNSIWQTGVAGRVVAGVACAVALALGGACSKSTDPRPDTVSTRYYTYVVVDSFPHDPTAFTQGLAWGPDGFMYEGTGIYGNSSIRRVELQSGQVDSMVGLTSSLFGEGIALVGSRIFQLTWKERIGLIWDRVSLTHSGFFAYQGEGWGLTFDGRRLIMSDGTSVLQFRDTTSAFTFLGSVQARDSAGPVDSLNELEYINGEVWANIWYRDQVARINPATGWVEGYVDFTGLLDRVDYPSANVLNGIAHDSVGKRIFVTGKLWPWLYQVNVVEVR